VICVSKILGAELSRPRCTLTLFLVGARFSHSVVPLRVQPCVCSIDSSSLAVGRWRKNKSWLLNVQ
jgi:hypothetical protein